MKRLWIIVPILLFLIAGGYQAASYATVAREGNKKEVKKKGAWLGVKLKSIETIENGKTERTEGALVDEVIEDSPAAAAGIEAGDVIIACNNVTIEDAGDLVKAMRDSKEGDIAKITLLRDGEQKTVEERLGASKAKTFVIQKRMKYPKKTKMPRPPHAPSMMWHQRGTYGFTLKTLNEQLGAYVGAPEGKGVLIEKVREESDAAKAGFMAGDVIVRAGKKTVEDAGDFKHVLGAFDAGEKIPVQILRKGKSMTIELEAKEVDDEKHIMMKHFGDLGDMEFEFHGDNEDIIRLEGMRGVHALEGLGDMDLDMDIDVDVEEMEDGLREVHIKLNGKELELQELQEELREELQEELQELQERIKIEVEEGEDGEMEVRVRKI